MKSAILLLACLVLASAAKASDLTAEDPTIIVDGERQGDVPAEETQKYEDELLDEMAYGGTEGDQETLVEDDKFLINGEKLGAQEMDFDEDPTEVIDGEVVPDEMDESAEDKPGWIWKKHPFSWCTVPGRQLLRKVTPGKGVITAEECQALCLKTPGCNAVEHWNKYNFACFWCQKIDLLRPYTNQNDLAYPAHVWEHVPGPTPTRPTRPSVTRPTIPIHPEVNVTCGKDEMWITIPKYLLPAVDRDHLRLTDTKCGAKETQSEFILHTSLTECGTKSRHTKNFVCYMNAVEEIPVEHHQIITRVRDIEIPFSCYYSNMGVVSAVGLQVKSKKIVFSKKGFGKFVLDMDIFPDGRYHIPYKKKDFPIMVELRKLLFVEVSVDTEDDRLAILAQDCWATPNANPLNLALRYVFIKDGCAVDDTVMDIPTADKRIQRFKLEAFKFVGDHQFVYMHCKVIVCNATDDNSRCAQGCVQRRKRSLMTQESKDEEYLLAQGPFMRSDEEETKLDETMKDMRDVDKSGTFPTLVAAMAVVAAVCVMGVSYFAWDKRKQKALRDYQRLTVSAEE